jgi:ribosomal protein L21
VSKTNEHKKINSEEFFKILEEKSSNLNNMDEFEKEAMEGFALLNDVDKSKQLVNDVNQLISERVNTSTQNKIPINRFIIIGAAASIILMIILSVFWLNTENNNELALSNHPEVIDEKKEETSKTLEKLAPIEEPPVPVESTLSGNTVNQNNAKNISSLENNKTEGTASSTKTTGPISYTYLEKDLESKLQSASDGDVSQSAAMASEISEKTPAQKKSTVDGIDKKVAEITTVSSGETSNNQYSKNNPPQENLAEDEIVSANTPVVKHEAKPLNDNAKRDEIKEYTLLEKKKEKSTSLAYYPGDKENIKKYVLNYFNEKKISTPTVGKYKINGTVNKNGELHVIKIYKISEVDCNCTENLQKALNEMKGWESASENGKTISSNVEFVINF